MAERKSAFKRAPARPELDQLLARSKQIGITKEEIEEQRVSFTYGNAPKGSRITKDSARTAARSILVTHQ